MMSYVPTDIDIDRSKGNSFVLYDKYLKLYLDVLNKLKCESALEYLKDSELENALLHFTCEIIAGYSVYKNTGELKEKIDVFLSDILRPLEEYEVLVPILYLDAKDLEIEIGDVIVKKFDEIALEEWGIRNDTIIFNDIVNKTMAIIPEKGNNPELVCDRARKKADFVIRILQVSISTNTLTSDKNTLFKQDEILCYKKKDTPSSVGAQWKRGYKALPIELNEDLEKSINKFLSSVPGILEEEKPPLKLRKRFRWALTWIGRSIEEENPDIKIIYLSTALEAILTTISDEEKGKTLAYRMLLLNFHVEKPFTDPVKVLLIYELRSKIVHGSEMGIASHHEYLIMKHVAIETLRYSLEIVRKEGLRKHDKFIKAIESYNEREKVLDWLEEQGDKKSLKIRDQMKQNRVQQSS
ncbi:hypothetical protein C5S39_04550 [Candidatus Methanophagaceae archaeon]|nr:hypothetical protein C5S39_04550 [Methanophagales archaeon]